MRENPWGEGGKKDRLAGLLGLLGGTAALGWLGQRSQLLVLNYHRIGDWRETPYDPSIFSATAFELSEQIAFLKRHFAVLGLDEALAVAEGKQRIRKTAILLTFDDGYRDNYELAAPVLRQHGVSGVFFLVSSYVGSNWTPWWDEIAYRVKHSRRQRLEAGGESWLVPAEGARLPIRDRILQSFKALPTEKTSVFLAELAASSGLGPLPQEDRLLMNWEEAADLLRNGMSIGSHTHSHGILARQTEATQREELALSRQVIAERLGQAPSAIAYPVGLPDCFTETTGKLVMEAGYRAGFSFYGGVNQPGQSPSWNLKRHAVAQTTPARFQLQTKVSALTGRWF